ncbi:hypothetical protein [Streptomyces sp. CB03911]|uniref:hypothetical protein n=1 Tax=Streptomycetaceae TaxID=2062 RepID=UPI00093D3EB5|nr:hypothetical protein [Streptomyces sp. CB03911]OKI20360.1 hypothetical protein A6A07_37140 [Streptomyces sp. CB03911]
MSTIPALSERPSSTQAGAPGPTTTERALEELADLMVAALTSFRDMLGSTSTAPDIEAEIRAQIEYMVTMLQLFSAQVERLNGPAELLWWPPGESYSTEERRLVKSMLRVGEQVRRLAAGNFGGPEPGGRWPVRREPGEMQLWVRSRMWGLFGMPVPQGGQSALYAALGARRAAIAGNDRAVEAFARQWLKLPNVTPDWREAVSSALMSDWESGPPKADGEALVAALRRESGTVHRQLQPLWERKVAGRRVSLLDAPVAGRHGLTLHDLASDGRHPQDDVLPWEPVEPRARVVFAGLSSEEQAVARVWSQNQGASWEEAARQAGVPSPHTFGQRVRTKLKRLGVQHTTRVQAAALTLGGAR